jgi:hypothetical protein
VLYGNKRFVKLKKNKEKGILKFYQFYLRNSVLQRSGPIKNNKTNVSKRSLKSNKKKEEFRSLPSKFRPGTAGTVPTKKFEKKIKKINRNVNKRFDKK